MQEPNGYSEPIIRLLTLFVGLFIASGSSAEPDVKAVSLMQTEVIGGSEVRGVALFAGPTSERNTLKIRTSDRTVESIELTVPREVLDAHFTLRTLPVKSPTKVSIAVGRQTAYVSVSPPTRDKESIEAQYRQCIAGGNVWNTNTLSCAAPPPPTDEPTDGTSDQAGDVSILYATSASSLPFGATVSVLVDEFAANVLGSSAVETILNTVSASNSLYLTQIEAGPGVPLQVLSIKTVSMNEVGLGYDAASDANGVMNAARAYRTSTPGEMVNSDITLLLTQSPSAVFPAGGRTYSLAGTFCASSNYAVTVVNASILESGLGPKVIAHMVGHLLGMGHVNNAGEMTNISDNSSVGSGYVMGYGGGPEITWSDASLQHFQERKHMLTCLEGSPQ